MKRFVAVLAALVLLALSFSGIAEGKGGKDREPLEMYTATVDRITVGRLIRDGYDVAAAREVAAGVEVDLVLTPTERDKLESQGLALGLKRNRDGLTATELFAAQAAGGYTVWRSFDEPGGLRDELYQIARRRPGLVKLEVIGRSVQGREIIALKVTKNARTVPDGSRPAVLYMSLQHAREWIGGEVNRRLLHHFVDGYGTDPQVTNLVSTRELWFVLVTNPDGYQYTFDVERLRRKTLADNDGDGQITNADGVDPNRNYAEHWGYDNEGSSPVTSDETFRGVAAASEPETQAMQNLMNRVGFEFLINYHSYGQLLLSTFGWQVQTASAGDPIYRALQGSDENPAIPGFDPGVGADLYITNGETTDFAHAVAKTIAWTPELGESVSGNGFLFPDDETLIQQEFEINLPFALDVATSAPNPADPVSHLGNTTQPMYVDAFPVSYGDPQVVQVLARRSLGPVTMKYQVNAGRVRSRSTWEWNGGERFGGPGDVYYRVMRSRVTAPSWGTP